MKRVLKSSLAMLLVAVLMFSLVACGENRNSPEGVLKSALNELKAGNFEKAEEYFLNPDRTMLKRAGMESIGDSISIIFKEIEYEIISKENVDENTVNITVEITTTDMTPVFNDLFSGIMEYAMTVISSGVEPTEEEITQKVSEIFVECASKPDLAKTTSEVVVKAVKFEDTWKLEADEAFFDAISGELSKAIASMTTIFE